ncbi:DUF2157 domain-containing protein [Pedobacter arcticus]|uniref:DUF2157 domain-containing protein n=1 Tax=Pedobacter arcticus TaxID=752140 RepID=UPI000316F8A6|nr:DUF2157 domain-containing protein [Pedobacter arcticus]
MKLDNDKAEFLKETIQHWQNKGIISADKAEELNNSFTVKSFDWQKLAQYAIYISLACGVFALGSLLLDKQIAKILSSLYNTPNIIICVFSLLAATYFLIVGSKRRQKKSHRVFSNEAMLVAGVLLIANGLAYLGKTIDKSAENYALLFLAAVPIYAFLGYYFKSRLIWIFALFSLGAWFGTQSSYLSKSNFYFLGMNYPLRFVCFGLVLTTLSFLFVYFKKLKDFQFATYFVGLLYTFIALWLLSIFGNFGRIDDWYKVSQLSLYGWAGLSIATCLITFYLGFRFKDELAREFGATFLIINLYSRFFEYFWDTWHKAIFFLVLALSFWLIGRKAEKIRNVEFLKEETDLKN